MATTTVTSALFPADGDARPGGLRFTTAILFCCLILQRFGVPFSGKAVSIVGPIGLALAAWGLLRGTLGFNRFRLAAFLVLAAASLLGLAWHAVVPGQFSEDPNLNSLSQFLLLTAFATLSFVEPVGEREFFLEVNKWFGFIAIAGIVQFLLQLVHLPLFAFTGVLPPVILFEYGYNLQIGIGVGELLKSNGFFLMEPSIFSQLMALALVIEILAFRRPILLTLYVAGLMLSFSGTGWIVLASFLLAAAIGMGWRGLAIVGGTVVVLGGLLAGASFLAPDLAGALQERVDEVSRPSTSGHQRFVTPFWVLDDMLGANPSAAVIGMGSGVSERLTLPYAYDVNTPVKITLEYGFPALLAYVLLFVGGRKSPIQNGILAPAATTAFLTGAYQQFPPMLFLILLLTSVANLRPGPQVPRHQKAAAR